MSARRFEPYPAYKESGVEWLGEIPAGWEVKPIRALARSGYKTFTDGDWIESPYIRDEGIRLIQTGNVGIGEYKEQGFRYIDEETFRSFRCTEILPGDVLICRLADPVGRACLAPELGRRMITSVDVCILKPASDVCAAFVVYALTGSEYLAWLGGICRGGTRDRVSRSMLGAIRVQKPHFAEQHAIATFLDRETAKIDALAAKKERLTELLQEQRTALITRAVTKGLDPNIPMKDSGVEWLGKIPAHWEVLALKRRARRIQTGTTPPTSESKYYEDGVIAWYGPGSFADDLPLQAPMKFIAESAVEAGVARVFEAGSAVVVTIGATIGKVAYMERPGSCNQQITGVTFDERRVHPRYGAYQLKRFEPVLRGIAPNTTLPILDQREVGYLPYVVPPLAEQRAIAAFLDQETAGIDALVAKVREAIERLKEMRTALISAAVTGKFDVREEVG